MSDINEKVEDIINSVDEEIKENLEKEVENEEILKLRAELEDYKKAYSLKLAEFSNFSKRKEKELQDFKEYASKDIILKMLDNLDNLERAVEASKLSKDYDALVEGINMSINNLKEVLNFEGVVELEALNCVYNPIEHQAISVMNDETKDNNTVIFVTQKGYKLKNKIIRPSLVIINKKEEKNEEEK